MLLTPDHPDFDKILVYLDNKVCRSFLAANDEQGWVDICDISAMAPLELTEESAAKPEDQNLNEWDEIPTKRKFGKVEFRLLKK